MLAYRLIDLMSEDIVGLAYRIPWLNVGAVVVIAYGASLLTTFLPARQAASVYPADALRFE
jgi:ABC-type lipoprotein release transport system permease subunit